MLKPIKDIIQFFSLDAKTAITYFGMAFIAFGILGTGSAVMSEVVGTSNEISESHNPPSVVFGIIYMLFIILLGLAYSVFGWKYSKQASYNLKVIAILGIAAIIWCIGYTLNFLEYMNFFQESVASGSEDPHPIEKIFSIAATAIGCFVIACYTIALNTPAIVVSYLIKQEQKSN